MTESETDRVIDKIAEHVGDAATALRPLAERVLHEVTLRGLATAVMAACVMAACLVGVVHFDRKACATESEEIRFLWICAAVVCLVLAAAATVVAYKGVSDVIAPTAHILGL